MTARELTSKEKSEYNRMVRGARQLSLFDVTNNKEDQKALHIEDDKKEEKEACRTEKI